MATFTRQRKLVDGKPSVSYKDCLRLDFSFRCAYCLIHEADNQGQDNFEVDHFQPKSRFPSLEGTYTNLYYSCQICNRRKGGKWPKPDEQARGERFVDPCAEDWEEHVEFWEDGSVHPLTDAGEYSVRSTRLDRDQLRRHRRKSPLEYFKRSFLRQLQKELQEILAEVRRRPDKARELREDIAALRRQFVVLRDEVAAAWNGKERMPPEPRCPY